MLGDLEQYMNPDNILGGVVAGVIASVIFIIAMRMFRPRIRISDNISVYPNDEGEEVLRIKIINLSYRAVADLTVQLYVEHKREVHGGPLKVRHVVGAKSSSQVQPGRRPFDKEVFDNCKRIRIEKQELIEALAAKPDGYLIAEVFARDAISGVGAIFEQKYALSADKFKHGSFELGNTMHIVPYAGALPFRIPGQMEAAKKSMSSQASVTSPETPTA